MVSSELQLANTILSVAGHAPYLAMGSAFIQVADVMSDSGWRRTVADDTNEDESLEVMYNLEVLYNLYTLIGRISFPMLYSTCGWIQLIPH